MYCPEAVFPQIPHFCEFTSISSAKSRSQARGALAQVCRLAKAENACTAPRRISA